MKSPLFLLLWLASSAAWAGDLQLHGALDLRLRADGAGVQRSWQDGGLGKLPTGAGFGGAVELHWQAAAAWQVVAGVQADADADPKLGLLEAYVRYRPVSLTPWRGSLRAGVFFPPVSLENDGIGWTSRWTLSPSVMNSWVGEELRSTGVEARMERRSEAGVLDLGLAVFGNNDPAGELLATRGWSLGDQTSTLGSWLRQPDVYSATARSPAPLYFQPFVENDNRPGWHADVAWQAASGLRLALLHYDNRADPTSSSLQDGRRVFSWRTRFNSVGLRWPLENAVLIAQAMDGSTAFEPREGRYLDTGFHAGFVLLGWNPEGRWRPALRLDLFSLKQSGASSPGQALNEHGRALTAALAWRPSPSLRLSVEWNLVHDRRRQRLLEGLGEWERASQFQLSMRKLF